MSGVFADSASRVAGLILLGFEQLPPWELRRTETGRRIVMKCARQVNVSAELAITPPAPKRQFQRQPLWPPRPCEGTLEATVFTS